MDSEIIKLIIKRLEAEIVKNPNNFKLLSQEVVSDSHYIKYADRNIQEITYNRMILGPSGIYVPDTLSDLNTLSISWDRSHLLVSIYPPNKTASFSFAYSPAIYKIHRESIFFCLTPTFFKLRKLAKKITEGHEKAKLAQVTQTVLKVFPDLFDDELFK
jgi:hypothetical protein